MRIFLDTSDVNAIKKWLPVIEGVTTNPVLLEKEGGSIKDVLELVGDMPVNVEVASGSMKGAIEAARASNVVIKMPLLRPDGGDNLMLIQELVSRGIKVNCTCLFSLGQVMLATKAGADYVSIFAGRIGDESKYYKDTMKDCSYFVMNERFSGIDEKPYMIVGSIRTVTNVYDAVEAGADIITIPPPIMERLVMHQNSLATVNDFEAAYNRLSS